ncbi:MAG TPA: hypothetical protein VGG64_25785 [Pirellulales bacterium]|jgi:hypothetical protein
MYVVHTEADLVGSALMMAEGIRSIPGYAFVTVVDELMLRSLRTGHVHPIRGSLLDTIKRHRAQGQPLPRVDEHEITGPTISRTNPWPINEVMHHRIVKAVAQRCGEQPERAVKILLAASKGWRF